MHGQSWWWECNIILVVVGPGWWLCLSEIEITCNRDSRWWRISGCWWISASERLRSGWYLVGHHASLLVPKILELETNREFNLYSVNNNLLCWSYIFWCIIFLNIIFLKIEQLILDFESILIERFVKLIKDIIYFLKDQHNFYIKKKHKCLWDCFRN